MDINSAVQSPALSVESTVQDSSTRRKLRTRTPRSYVLSELAIDDPESVERPNRTLQLEKKSNPSVSTIQSPDENQNYSAFQGSNPSSKLTGRLKISREPRIPTPPPLPSCSTSYLQSDKFPAWLLAHPMVMSSPEYLAQQAQQLAPSRQSCSQPPTQTSPIRGNRSFFPNSPSKVRSSLDRHPSSSSFRMMHPSVQGPNSTDEDVAARREQFWEPYEYDNTAPHLQPKYFDKPLPTGEQWADLDIQNARIIPAPVGGSQTAHLFDVFSSNGPESDDEPMNEQVENNKTKKVPFGFNFLPLDYNGHPKPARS